MSHNGTRFHPRNHVSVSKPSALTWWVVIPFEMSSDPPVDQGWSPKILYLSMQFIRIMMLIITEIKPSLPPSSQPFPCNTSVAENT